MIDPTTDQGRAMYARLRALVDTDPHELLQGKARIALAWCTSWKPDVDGRMVLGKCRKANDLDRELAAFDFVILLNQAWWFDLAVTDEMRAAILDHELCHAAPACDPRTGEQLRDERGRWCWRIRKHDLEEFIEVAERHGTYKRDVEMFYLALRRSALGGFKSCGNCDPRGFVAVENGVIRCDCWMAWQQRVSQAVAS